MKLHFLITCSSAIAGTLLMISGSLIQASFIVPSIHGGIDIFYLPNTLQVITLLLIALVVGPRSAALSSLIYLSLGLMQLPIFTVGGNSSYLLNPSFGYLAGFVPAAWLVGQFARQYGVNDPLKFSIIAIFGLNIIHLCGIINICFGYWSFRWSEPLMQLVTNYSLGSYLGQLVLACGAGIISIPLRKLLLIKP